MFAVLHRSKRSWGWSLPTFYQSLGFWGIGGVHAREYANDYDDANVTSKNLLLKNDDSVLLKYPYRE